MAVKDDCIKKVDEYSTHWAFRVRPPSQFIKFRTPKWARHVARSTSKGAFITMGQTKAGTWLLQSVKIKKKGKTETQARKLAMKIINKLKSCPLKE